MWNDIINIAISNGIFAALFVSLLVYALKDGNVREKRLFNAGHWTAFLRYGDVHRWILRGM